MNRIALHTDNVVITFAFRKKTGASRENLSVTLQTNTNPYWNICSGKKQYERRAVYCP